MQARTHLQAAFADLSGDERDALLKHGRSGRALKSAGGTNGADLQPAQLAVQEGNGEVCFSVDRIVALSEQIPPAEKTWAAEEGGGYGSRREGAFLFGCGA